MRQQNCGLPRNSSANQGRWLGCGEMGQPTLWTGIAHARKKEVTAVGVISANNSQTSGKYKKMRAQWLSESHSCPFKRATLSTKVNPIKNIHVRECEFQN